jgi:hypothetical protein
MPLGWVVDDRVALLKIVVLVSRALAGLLLYPVVERAYGDRVAGLAAVGLFHAVPLPFVVIGNANLTYAFGQSAAVATIVAAALVGSSRAGLRAGLGLFAVAALAFLSHVGIFPLLFALLLSTAAGFRWLGGPALRRAAAVVAAAAIVAAVFSVVVYYGHFGEAYRTLARVRAQPAASARDATPAPPASAGTPAARPPARALPLSERAASAGEIAVRAFGWPLLALAAAGVWAWMPGRGRGPLGIVIGATLVSAVVFVAGSIAAPVEPAFWRYTAEFISRVYYVAMPALVLLAAGTAARGWARGGPVRAATVVALALSLVPAARRWMDWIG